MHRDSIDGYRDYLAAYPHSAQARRVRAIQAARREAAFWRRSVDANIADAYWTYLRWLALEILGKYHHRVHSAFHSALSRPPLAVWSELAVSNPPGMPRDRTEFLAGLLPYEMRLPRRDGFHRSPRRS